MSKNTTVIKRTELSRFDKWLCGCAGGILLTASFISFIPLIALVLSPKIGQVFSPEVYEIASKGLLPDNLASTTAIIGAVLILFATNGYRITSAKIMGNDFEAGNLIIEEDGGAETEAERKLLDSEKVKISKMENSDNTEEGDVWQKEGFTFYKMPAIPIDVLQKLLKIDSSAWPNEICKPAKMKDIQYAYRRSGRGNPRWYFKMHGSESPVQLVLGRGGYDNELTV